MDSSDNFIPVPEDNMKSSACLRLTLDQGRVSETDSCRSWFLNLILGVRKRPVKRQADTKDLTSSSKVLRVLGPNLTDAIFLSGGSFPSSFL